MLVGTSAGRRYHEAVTSLSPALRFHDTDNDQIIAYSKQDSRVAVLVIVSVDHAHMQHGWVRVPMADWAAPGFDDRNWPAAALFTHRQMGVPNLPAYTNFVPAFAGLTASRRPETMYSWKASLT